ncbi:hypothetical protein R1sor_020966 [Riccia sorocarpa]|uniref:Uncharacterized protein n=1 Tax=Riccia sorocarpa TaxID=122646 RepID=A0ABD3GJ20_9MARC
MERNLPKVYSAVIYGSGFPITTAAKGVKFMDQQQEPKGVAAPAGGIPGLVTDNNNSNKKFKYEQTEVGSSSSPGHVVRKRKEYNDVDYNEEIDSSPFDTNGMYERKRVRQNGGGGRSKESLKPPQQRGTTFKAGVEIGSPTKRINSPFHFYDEVCKSERIVQQPKPGCEPARGVLKPGTGVGLKASETSIASCDVNGDAGDDKKSGGDASSLTSNQDDDSRTTSSGKESDWSNSFFDMFSLSGSKSEATLFTGVVRQDVSGAHVHVPLSSADQPSSRWTLKQHIRNSVDDEVISGQRTKIPFPSYSSRERELNRVFDVGVWDAQQKMNAAATSADERSKASTSGLDVSGCSTAEINVSNKNTIDNKGTTYVPVDVRSSSSSSKLKQQQAQPSGKHGFSSSSRQHQSRSSVTSDICVSSDSVSLRLERESGSSNLEPYYNRFKTSSAFSPMASTSTGRSMDDRGTAATASERAPLPHHLSFIQEEQEYTRSRSLYTSSKLGEVNVGTDPVPVTLAMEQEMVTAARNVSTYRDDASSGSGSGDSDPNRPQPTFVLSSGRLSKTQEAQLGKRPTTIDDDFDEYFAQLML